MDFEEADEEKKTRGRAIVSNDNYRDLLSEGPEMKKAIQ
jgi:hypothetical protein